MFYPGAKNLITDVDNILVGNAEDNFVGTGTTVLMAPENSIASADIRGGAPGTRGVGALNPYNLVDTVDAIVLSGGSTWGLEAASSSANSIGKDGRGFRSSPEIKNVPMVPAAILFDLNNGGNKDWGDESPYQNLGIKATENASTDFNLGNTGAGYGAKAGSLKGGLGSSSFVSDKGLQIGGLFAVNSYGSVVNSQTGQFWAATDEIDEEFGNKGVPSGLPDDILSGSSTSGLLANNNTTIGIIATNAKLSPKEAKRIAIMAHTGMSRAIRPIHTPVDGDIIFVVSTNSYIKETTFQDINILGELGARVCSRSISRAIYEAESLFDMISWKEKYS
ncbi:MAG: peptidase T4 [Rhodobiaceae bacterium]|nr:peptidase T4 [Rhodobiaceae bacterium]